MTSEERAQKFLIMTCPFQDLGSACDWLKQIPSWHVISMEFLYSFLRRHFAVKPLMASRNVSCFLRLRLQYNDKQVCVALACSRLSDRGGKGGALVLPSVLPFYFRVCLFSIQRTRLSRSLEQTSVVCISRGIGGRQ